MKKEHFKIQRKADSVDKSRYQKPEIVVVDVKIQESFNASPIPPFTSY